MRARSGGGRKSVTHFTETSVDVAVIILTVGSALPPQKQAFLDMLAARAAGRETAPATAAEDVPPALAAIAAPATESWEDKPATSPELMDLGADAQAQGTAMALRASAGTLASVIRDLGTLEYFDQASQLVPVMEWAVEEHNRLMAELEQRGQERRGEA